MELPTVARDWATLDTERSLPSPMTSDTEQDRITPSELSETALFFSSQRFALWGIELKKPVPSGDEKRREERTMGKQKLWQKMRPDSNEELEKALKSERTLQAVWYGKMSGQVAWNPGERGRLSAVMDAMSREVNGLIAQKAANDFASLMATEVKYLT